MKWKVVRIPELSYDALKFYAKSHNMTLSDLMKKMLFNWTMSFWSDPSNYDCVLDDVKTK